MLSPAINQVPVALNSLYARLNEIEKEGGGSSISPIHLYKLVLENQHTTDLAERIGRESGCQTFENAIGTEDRQADEPNYHSGFDNPFRALWTKTQILHSLIRTCRPYLNLKKTSDLVRQILVSMAARLQAFVLTVYSLRKDYRGELGVQKDQEGKISLQLGTRPGYQMSINSCNSPQTSSVRYSDREYTLQYEPANLKLTKKVVEAELGDDGKTNPGGWLPGSLIHTIELDEINKREGEEFQEPIILEIGVKPNHHTDHKIYSKLIHKADPGSSQKDIIIEEEITNTDAFERSLDIEFPNSFEIPESR